jgi:hypothetical protein
LDLGVRTSKSLVMTHTDHSTTKIGDDAPDHGIGLDQPVAAQSQKSRTVKKVNVAIREAAFAGA